MTDSQLACLAIAAGPFLIGLAWVLGTSAPIVSGFMLDRTEHSVLRLRDWMEG